MTDGKWLSDQLAYIDEEARLTKPFWASQYDAVRELIAERVERGILNEHEAEHLRSMQDAKLATTRGWQDAGLIR